MLEGKAILVVEDEPMISAMLDDLLTDLGCRVVGPAFSLAQAQELLERGDCHAAIVDLHVNGTMAHPLIEALRSRGVPVIIATGYGADPSELPSDAGSLRSLRNAACRGGAAGLSRRLTPFGVAGITTPSRYRS